MDKLQLTKTKKILKEFWKVKSRQITERLKSTKTSKRLPSKSLTGITARDREIFSYAAKLDMKKLAKKEFKNNTKPIGKFRPPQNKQGKKLFGWLKKKIKDRGLSVKRCIYIYWGYRKNEKNKKPLCVYVGKTKGKYEGERSFMDDFRITKVKLYKVKQGKPKLSAAECLGQHAYSPPGKILPLANKIKASQQKGKKHRRKIPSAKCDVCKNIKKAWKILYPKKK